MRALSPEEQVLLNRRRAEESAYIQDRVPILIDFAEALELNEPEMIIHDPERFLPAFDLFMRDQDVGDDDRVEMTRILGYFIGDVLNQRYRGRWFLNENADSRTFLRYVVGDFKEISNPQATVEPFYVASDFLATPPGRSLKSIVNHVEEALVSA